MENDVIEQEISSLPMIGGQILWQKYIIVNFNLKTVGAIALYFPINLTFIWIIRNDYNFALHTPIQST